MLFAVCIDYQVYCSFGLCSTLYKLWYCRCSTEWVDHVEVKAYKGIVRDYTILNELLFPFYSTIVLWVAQNTQEVRRAFLAKNGIAYTYSLFFLIGIRI